MPRPRATTSLRGAAFLAAMVLTLAAASGGCDRLSGPSELEEKIATEQGAIAAYSTQIPPVDALQQKFVQAWQTANELRDVRAFRDAIGTQVIPALREYVQAMGAVQPESTELARIHLVMVQAYGGTEEDFRRFADGLTSETLEERYKTLLEQMDEVSKTEQRYRDELKTYYARNRVRLLDTP